MILTFDNIVNARDLGGTPTADGHSVRPKRLLRTAHLNSASDKDLERLNSEFCVKRVFDFRSVPETSFQPDRIIRGAQHISLPTLDVEAEKESGDAVPDETWLDLPKHIVQLSFTNYFQRKARELYPSLVLSEFSQLQYAAFMNLVLETPDGAVLWHCAQGKDRTGIGAAFILGALGVSDEEIIADFDRSNLEYLPLVNSLEAQVEAQGGGEDEKDVIRAFMGVSTRNFCNTIGMIQERWGSLLNYIQQVLDLTDQDILTLRDRLLE